ncbi:M23 family metallopeptidase [Catellatospora coxensis]|uniref:M23 family metallopeptidase n=1 Tax=Catellatospora coxensis TaxID=310354 RepID=UPI0031DE8186
MVRVKCNSSTGTCDHDGSLDQTGCGWYVDVRHAANLVYAGARVTSVVTRYCHMIQRPQVAVGDPVAAGTVLGFVGSSGRPSGPHLHFQVHLNVPAGGAAATPTAPTRVRSWRLSEPNSDREFLYVVGGPYRQLTGSVGADDTGWEQNAGDQRTVGSSRRLDLVHGR